LADLGYTVNMAAADAYTRPSTSTFSAGSTTTRSTIASVLAAESEAEEPVASAISGRAARSGTQARNIVDSLVLALLDRPRAAEQSSSDAEASVPPVVSSWSAEVDWLFAGESDWNASAVE
jgi:hypothetical protein